MGDPTVSVIIPCYNYGEYLRECVLSVLNQTHQPQEVIIVDDGSTDSSCTVGAALAKEYPGRVRFYSQENAGVAAARNYAISLASGAAILPLDADDRLHPRAIELLLPALCSDADVGYAYSALENTPELPGESRFWYPGMFLKSTFLHSNNSSCTALWWRSDWQAGVRYRELIYEDWDLWAQLVAKGKKGAYVPHPLLKYRRHNLGRHCINSSHQLLGRMQIVLNNPSLYDSAFVQQAELLRGVLPECLKHPTIVFLAEPGLGELSTVPTAWNLIGEFAGRMGHFTAFLGDFREAPNIPGTMTLPVRASDGIETMRSLLHQLGPKLICCIQGSTQFQRYISSHSAVRKTVMLNQEGGGVSSGNVSQFVDSMWKEITCSGDSSGNLLDKMELNQKTREHSQSIKIHLVVISQSNNPLHLKMLHASLQTCPSIVSVTLLCPKSDESVVVSLPELDHIVLDEKDAARKLKELSERIESDTVLVLPDYAVIREQFLNVIQAGTSSEDAVCLLELPRARWSLSPSEILEDLGREKSEIATVRSFEVRAKGALFPGSLLRSRWQELRAISHIPTFIQQVVRWGRSEGIQEFWLASECILSQSHFYRESSTCTYVGELGKLEDELLYANLSIVERNQRLLAIASIFENKGELLTALEALFDVLMEDSQNFEALSGASRICFRRGHIAPATH
ncbi:MAG: glycosyltransferase family 2 protein, partial [Bdellovibrionales bacterium]|nr:glycosyltransferase family 2 protein [Bdellovibrionales bacterium]